MSRKRKSVNHQSDPTLASSSERNEAQSMTKAANHHFTETNDFSDSERVQELEEQLETAIVKVDDRKWRFGRISLTPVKLVIPQDWTGDEIFALGHALSSMRGAINFWLGDWANLILRDRESAKGTELSEDERHKIYEDLVDEFNLESVKSLRQYASVCRIIPPSNRLDGVHYSNHQLVAFLPKELKGREKEFLEMAFDQNMSKRTLAEKIKQERAKFLPKKSEPVYDAKSMLKKVKRLTRLLILSDDARLTDKDRKSYQKDLEDLKQLVTQLEDKLI